MATSIAPAPRVNAKSRPLTVELLLTINGTGYAVSPLANAPGGVKSFRLAKVGGDEAVYDLDAFADRIECSCPSYTKTHEGTSSACKHGRACIMVGLLEYPDFTPAEAARAAYDDAREAEALKAEAPAPKAPAFDRDIYRAQNAVAAGTALWLSHRHLHTSEPLPTPDHARDIVLVDDDGTALETPAEMAKRHSDEFAALVAVSELRADWLCDKPSEAACCSSDEPMPCTGCLLGEGPSDLADHTWDDAHIWTVTEPEPSTLAVFLDRQAAGHRRIGGANHEWLAGKLTALAEQARFLDAATPEAFDDRLAAMLDCAADAAEARHAARCC